MLARGVQAPDTRHYPGSQLLTFTDLLLNRFWPDTPAECHPQKSLPKLRGR